MSAEAKPSEPSLITRIIKSIRERTVSALKRALRWLLTRISGPMGQSVLVITVATLVALGYPDFLARNITTWHYFMSAAFQGLAALVSISLLSFFFLHERGEAKLQSLKDDCVRAARQLYTDYPDYFDQGFLIAKLDETRLRIIEWETVYYRFKGTSQDDREKPSKEEVREAEKLWLSAQEPFRRSADMLAKLNRQKAATGSLPTLVGEYVVPIFLPMLFALVMLATSDSTTESPVRFTASILIVLLLTILVIARYGLALALNMHTVIAEKVPGGQEPEKVIETVKRFQEPRPPAFLIEYPPEW